MILKPLGSFHDCDEKSMQGLNNVFEQFSSDDLDLSFYKLKDVFKFIKMLFKNAAYINSKLIESTVIFFYCLAWIF